MPVALSVETIRDVPKVLLHDHLDGGLRSRTIIELAEAVGYPDLPTDDPEEMAAWFLGAAHSGSLVRYLETFGHTVGVMQTADALVRVASECAQDLAADGVVYAEVRFAPELHVEQGLVLEDVVEAVLEGFRLGTAEAAAHGRRVRVGCLLTAMRHAARSREIAELAVRYRDVGVVGFDLAGPEDGFPPDRIPAAIALLDRAGAHRTIHAGEAFGIESIRAALDGAHAERLGHGVRIMDDVADDGTPGPLARRVREAQVPLEIAPSSNVQTGAYPSLAAHPVDRLHRLGFAVTVNTDNRLMSGVSASSELADVTATFGWTWDDVRTVTERALAGAFLPAEERARLLADVVRPGFAALHR